MLPAPGSVTAARPARNPASLLLGVLEYGLIVRMNSHMRDKRVAEFRHCIINIPASAPTAKPRPVAISLVLTVSDPPIWSPILIIK
jgi:hypothetical protein